MPQLVCKDLTLGYDGREVLKNVSFELNEGDYICVLGANGSGKTTLIRTILGLLPVLSGEMRWQNAAVRSRVGYLPQSRAERRDFPATAREIVLSGCQNSMGLRPFYSAREKAMAKSNMEKLGIGELEKRSFSELSGGQQQRVLLARALCAAERVLLLDEPASSLDPDAAREMYELIKKLNREDGMSVIMISHDVAAALKYADKILRVGDDMFFGTAREYAERGEAR